MKDETLLVDYIRFVDEVTSDASKDPQDFSDALDIIDETSGVSPERLITAAMGICAEGGEFTEVVKAEQMSREYQAAQRRAMAHFEAAMQIMQKLPEQYQVALEDLTKDLDKDVK